MVSAVAQKVTSSYKNSDFGQIPEDWEILEAFDFRPYITSGSRGWARHYSDSGAPFIRIGNLSHDDIYPDLSDLRHVNVNAHDPEAVRTRLEDGDVLVSITADIGAIGYISAEIPKPAYINQHIACIRLPSGKINSRFVAYFLSSSGPQRRFSAMVDVGAKSGLNLTAIGKLKLLVPPRKEQNAIATALLDADALIEGLESLIAKKRAIKQGALQELLSPQSDWVEVRLGDSAQLKARIGWQGLTTGEYLDSGEYHLVTGADFYGGFIDWSHCHFVDKSRYDQDKYIQLRENDVLVTKDGTIGKVACIDHLPKPATLNSGVFVIRPLANAFRPKFFYYLLMSPVFEEFLARLSAGSTISHLYQKDFIGFSFSVPPTDQQQDEIASTLLDMDHDIQASEARLAKARQIKQGMMQELLTGRMRLV
jgi:type I restriction enzyme, S subunit